MQQETAKFESWAIVEIMGHIKVAGMCTTQNFGNTVMLRVDIPETDQHPAHTQMYGMGSIFSIKPCDEQTACAHAELWQVTPIIEYSVKVSVSKRAERLARDIIDSQGVGKIGAGPADVTEDEDYEEEEYDENGNLIS